MSSGVANVTRRLELMRPHITSFCIGHKGALGLEERKQAGTGVKAGCRSGWCLTLFYRRWMPGLKAQAKLSTEWNNSFTQSFVPSLHNDYIAWFPLHWDCRGLEKHLWVPVTNLRFTRLFAHFTYLKLYQDGDRHSISNILLVTAWPMSSSGTGCRSGIPNTSQLYHGMPFNDLTFLI